MTKLYSFVQSFMADKQGATAIEYGLIAAGIAVGISAVVFTFGGDLRDLFTEMSGKLNERSA